MCGNCTILAGVPPTADINEADTRVLVLSVADFKVSANLKYSRHSVNH